MYDAMQACFSHIDPSLYENMPVYYTFSNIVLKKKHITLVELFSIKTLGIV
jgi:hypothetical protein